MQPFGQFAVSKFGHHDGAVHQHADSQDQGEQNHNINGQAHGIEHQNTEQERGRNSQANQACGAQAKGRDDDDHHQQNRTDDIVLQIVEHAADVLGLILDEIDLDTGGPLLGPFRHQMTYLINGFDNILTQALLDFQGHAPSAINARETIRVLKIPAHSGDIPQRDDPIAKDLDGQVQHILGGFKQAGHLDGKASLARVQGAGSDQLIIPGDGADQFLLADVVAFHPRRIEQDLQQFLPLASDISLKYAGQRLQLILQITGQAQQGALRHIAGQGNDQDGKQPDIDFVRGGLVGFIRQVRFDQVNGFAHVPERLVHVKSRIELQQCRSMAGLGPAAHFLDALDGA